MLARETRDESFAWILDAFADWDESNLSLFRSLFPLMLILLCHVFLRNFLMKERSMIPFVENMEQSIPSITESFKDQQIENFHARN